MVRKIFLILGFITLTNASITIEVNNPNPAFDLELYENVLDADECIKQIDIVQSNTLLWLQFTDAGLRIPRGITEGNTIDLGNYPQCLNIRHETEDTEIQGKYCIIHVPTTQNLTVPFNMKWSGFDPTSLIIDDETQAKVEQLNSLRAQSLSTLGIWDDSFSKTLAEAASSIHFTLAMCIPKPCTTQEAISHFFFNVSVIGFEYSDRLYRLPDDKPWSPADTVATVIFSIIGLLTVLSTSYDLIYRFWFKNDQKNSNPLYTSFSVYTNGRRLNTFTSNAGTMHCIDGIRALAMIWVVLGHSFSTENFIANPIALSWMFSKESIWITSAPITVDTFFCLSGVVLVYSVAGKMSGAQLLKNLPLFYLNRLLRLTPILAVAVLLQASYFNRMLDGPVWSVVEHQTNACRTYWWLTLLHVQNFINPLQMCLIHSWYVAIDFHCYLLSPLVLFWVLGRSRKVAWVALATGLLAIMTGAAVYNFIQDFPSGIIQPGHPMSDNRDYHTLFYFNTLTRASPFFVGMMGGYILHLLRGKKLQLSWISVVALWVCAASLSTLIFYYPAFIMDMAWDNQFVDNLVNSTKSAAWSVAICWMVIACVHGYGGPVNWFLSLDIWKLPARISYAIFIFHYPMMFAINGMALAPAFFSVPRFFFKFLAHMSLALVVSFLITLLIDSPCSTLCKQLLGGKTKKPVKSENQDVDAKPTSMDAECKEVIETHETKESNGMQHT